MRTVKWIRNNFVYAAQVVLISLLALANSEVRAQEPDEAEIETLAANADAENMESDEPAIQVHIQIGKIDLNRADAADLLSTGIVSTDQAKNLIQYRNLLGRLVSVFELQAVPGWDISLIEKLKPYIIVSQASRWDKTEARIRPPLENLVVIRAARRLELARGYVETDSLGRTHYTGNPAQIYLRYSLNLKNRLTAGFIAEKDAGEQFGHGFDFYSFHFWYTTTHWLKYIALGDFAVNYGQGLIHWQGIAFSKSSNLFLLEKQSQAIRPYKSSAESGFHRGLAVGWEKGRWHGNLFIARDLTDANLEQDANNNQFASSITESGYHRTSTEIANRNNFRQTVLGGSLGYGRTDLQLNGNLVGYWFNYPIQREKLPYNRYAIAGRTWLNYSLDYSYVVRNIRFFGEIASDRKGSFAALAGLVMSADPTLDVGILYRNMGEKFRSIDAAAFTEASEPANENGLWLGLNLKTSRYFAFAAFADFFSFPWLKYRVDAPSNGADYLLRADWHPDKHFHLDSRIRLYQKSLNVDVLRGMRVTGMVRKLSWRNQFSLVLSRDWELRSRLELNKYAPEAAPISRGFLTNLDLFYRPPKSIFSLNSRVEWFETDDYNSRAYTYENDLPYVSYVPVLYGSGFRYYLNIKISYHSKFTMGLKWAQSLFSGVEEIGSGWDEIKGKKRSDFRAEMLIKF